LPRVPPVERVRNGESGGIEYDERIERWAARIDGVYPREVPLNEGSAGERARAKCRVQARNRRLLDPKRAGTASLCAKWTREIAQQWQQDEHKSRKAFDGHA